MSDLTSIFAYNQGAEAAKEAAEASGGGFNRDWEWLTLDENESIFLRFLSDAYLNPNIPHVGAWISVMQHNSILTCPRPEWHKTGEFTKDRSWPTRMKCVCRKTLVGPEGAKQELHLLLPDAAEYVGCYVCDNRRSEKGGALKGSGRTWALAVVREQVSLPDGSVSYVTKTVEVEQEDGTKVTKPVTVVVNQAHSNFFKQLEGVADAYGTNTILDRDFKVTRVGKQLSTDYIIVAMPQVDFTDASGQNVVLDLRIPEHFAAFDTGIKLAEIVADQASVSWQRRWFDESYVPPVKEKAEGNGQGAPAAQQAKPSAELDQDAAKAMADRLTSYGQPAAAPAAAPAAQPAAAPAPAPAAAPAPAPVAAPPGAVAPTPMPAPGAPTA